MQKPELQKKLERIKNMEYGIWNMAGILYFRLNIPDLLRINFYFLNQNIPRRNLWFEI
jgi:hypothetical protein